MNPDLLGKKLAIFGAGAVGCWFAFLLKRSGADLVLVGRARHVDAIRKNGLRVDSAQFTGYIAVPAETDPAACADADIVLICVKSPANAGAVQALRHVVRPDAVIVSMQNGIENAEELERGLGRPVLSAAVYVACEMAGPGHLVHHGRCAVVLGEGSSPAAEGRMLARVLTPAGVTVTLSKDVRIALWEKLILNCAYNALCGITGKTIGEMVKSPEAMESMRALISECVAVARCEGVAIDDDVDRQLSRIIATIPPRQLASMRADLRDGKTTEIDQLNGLIVRRARTHGIQVPANKLMVGMVHLLQTQASTGRDAITA
jgi:2-dehydropantoate 2-reductase